MRESIAPLPSFSAESRLSSPLNSTSESTFFSLSKKSLSASSIIRNLKAFSIVSRQRSSGRPLIRAFSSSRMTVARRALKRKASLAAREDPNAITHEGMK